MSWDVVLQKFDRGSEATFDLNGARSLLGRTRGFRELEPGIGEVEGRGYAEVYYGAEPSSDVTVSARGRSPEVIELICELAAELRMAVFFPTVTGWSVAVLGVSQAEDLPDGSWEGWENFDEESRPPMLVVCADAEELAALCDPPTTAGARGRTEASKHCGAARSPSFCARHGTCSCTCRRCQSSRV